MRDFEIIYRCADEEEANKAVDLYKTLGLNVSKWRREYISEDIQSEKDKNILVIARD